MNASNLKEVPALFNNKENCCGCAACYSICPQNAIFMQEDEEGFLYPHIDVALCVRCYQCINVCVFKKDQKAKGYL